MSGDTTATERLLEVSNKLWDAMYESGEVPTYAERAHYYLALKDAMDENAKLRELARDMYRCSDPCNDCPHYNGSNDGFYCNLGIGWKARRMHELGIEVE